MSRQTSGAPLARSNSFLGTIKNLVSAPLTWLGAGQGEGNDSYGEFEDGTPGKRRRLPPPPLSSDTGAETDDDAPSKRFKRLRVDSPERRDLKRSEPYLDPPHSSFVSTSPQRSLARGSSLVSRHPTQRHTASPTSRGGARYPPPPPSSATSIGRTLSMEPPSFSSNARAPSLSPTRRLQMRKVISPQPSSSNLAAGHPLRIPGQRWDSPARTSEPPAEQRIFVRNPTVSMENIENQAIETLGSMRDAQRNSISPVRRSVSILQMDRASPIAQIAPTQAEIAIHDLDMYKTPLLPTRLRQQGAGAVPDIFKPRARKTSEKAGSSSKSGRLSRSNSGKSTKDEPPLNSSKPYAGTSGMKRLLARRQAEKEAEEQRKKQNEPISVPQIGRSQPVKAASGEAKAAPAMSAFGLRAGRRTENRSLRGESRNTYSADFDESFEAEEEKKQLEEAAAKVPEFKISSGLSFAPITPKASVPPPPERKASPEPLPVSIFGKSDVNLTPPSLLQSAPIATPPPTAPTLVKAADVAPSISTPPPASENGRPNFFANSPTLHKISPAPSASSLFGNASTGSIVPPNPFASKSSSNLLSRQSTDRMSVEDLSTASVTTPAPSIAAVPTPAVRTEPASSVEKPSNPFSFGTSATKAPSEPAAPLAPSTFSFGAATQPAIPKPAEQSPFSFAPSEPKATPVTSPAKEETARPSPLFGGSASLAPFSAPASPAGTPFAFGTNALPPANPFGQPTDGTTKAFGAPAPATAFSFGSRPSTAQSEVKPAPAATAFSFGAAPSTPPVSSEHKPFSFGTSTPAPSAAAAPAPFSFGTPTTTPAPAPASTSFGGFGSSNVPNRPITPPSTNEFSMEESPTRDISKPAQPFSFGGSTGGFESQSNPFGQSNATSAPFNFGQSGSATSNPFGKAEEKPKDSTPSGFAGFGQTQAAIPAPFSFGSSKPAEQPSTFAYGSPTAPAATPGFAFGNQTTATANPFGNSGAPATTSPTQNPAPFSFGQAAPTNGAFNFGSNPSSPAVANPSLPAASGGAFTFGGGASGGASAGSNLFNIGAAPQQASTQRLVRKMPNRRGTAKR